MSNSHNHISSFVSSLTLTEAAQALNTALSLSSSTVAAPPPPTAGPAAAAHYQHLLLLHHQQQQQHQHGSTYNTMSSLPNVSFDQVLTRLRLHHSNFPHRIPLASSLCSVLSLGSSAEPYPTDDRNTPSIRIFSTSHEMKNNTEIRNHLHRSLYNGGDESGLLSVRRRGTTVDTESHHRILLPFHIRPDDDTWTPRTAERIREFLKIPATNDVPSGFFNVRCIDAPLSETQELGQLCAQRSWQQPNFLNESCTVILHDGAHIQVPLRIAGKVSIRKRILAGKALEYYMCQYPEAAGPVSDPPLEHWRKLMVSTCNIDEAQHWIERHVFASKCRRVFFSCQMHYRNLKEVHIVHIACQDTEETLFFSLFEYWKRKRTGSGRSERSTTRKARSFLPARMHKLFEDRNIEKIGLQLSPHVKECFRDEFGWDCDYMIDYFPYLDRLGLGKMKENQLAGQFCGWRVSASASGYAEKLDRSDYSRHCDRITGVQCSHSLFKVHVMRQMYTSIMHRHQLMQAAVRTGHLTVSGRASIIEISPSVACGPTPSQQIAAPPEQVVDGTNFIVCDICADTKMHTLEQFHQHVQGKRHQRKLAEIERHHWIVPESLLPEYVCYDEEKQTYVCTLCEKELPSQQQMDSHTESAVHKRKVASQSQQIRQQSTVGSIVGDFCTSCNLFSNEMDSHVQGRQHMKNQEILAVMKLKGCAPAKLFCITCLAAFSSEEAQIAHWVGKSHRKKVQANAMFQDQLNALHDRT
jgi:Zinc-finger of C2H2 type